MTAPTTSREDLQFLFALPGEDKGPRLPLDLLKDVPRRVALVSGLMLAILPLNVLGNLIAGTTGDSRLRFLGLAVGWVVSLTVFVAARWGRMAPPRFAALGLAYEVVLAATIAVASAEYVWVVRGPVAMLSPVAAIVMLYPVVVPATPGRVIAASLAAVAMEPVVMLALVGIGAMPAPDGATITRHLWTDAVAVVIAVAVSRVIYRLGARLEAARAIGSYHLERKLGAGGMGEVWRARHHFLARPAAVKLIRPEALGGADKELVERTRRRFEREAQVTATLRSPHTVELFDFGVTSDGTFYFVMELLEGLDLDTLVERHGVLPPERVAFLLLQACRSLQEAHEAGVIHRDIKPANIFACVLGGEHDFVKVLDFGLVKRVGVPEGVSRAGASLPAEDASPAGQTRAGRVVGTPAFISPEQVPGDEAVDGRADLYSLACVAWWMLTGKLVFDKPGAKEMLLAHLQDAPPDVRTVAPATPPELAAIITSCLAKLPSERPASARELADRLTATGLAAQWTPARAAAWWAAVRQDDATVGR